MSALNDRGGILHLSITEKPTTVRLEAGLRARVEDEGAKRGWKISPYLSWLITQFLNLEFLEKENRDFVAEICGALGRPWNPLDVINALVSEVRREIRRGNLRPTFWKGQLGKVMKSDAKSIARANETFEVKS